MTYRLTCGDWSCSREAKQEPWSIAAAIRADKKLTTEEDRENYAASVLRCNVHVGAMKRQKYGTSGKGADTRHWVPITDDVRAWAEKSHARAQAEAAKVNAERQDAEHQRQRGLAAHYWAEHDAEPDYETIYTEDNRGGGLRREWGIYRKDVPAGEVVGVEYRHSEARVILQEDSRYDDVTFPVTLQQQWTSHPTAKLSRAMAEALVKAAEVTDAVNARRRAKHKGEL